ncbi:MAG: YggS family pyridoxal phosphate-dependent enzyme [Bacteroidota bacterium]
MQNLKENFLSIKKSLPENVKLIVVTKNQDTERIKFLYDEGHRIFGENKVQELLTKKEKLPSDIEWHMIGHLQSNKVKYLTSFIGAIHSVDSFNLLKKIDKEAKNNSRKIDCLLQLHIAMEETKFGFSMEEIIDMLDSAEFKQLANVKIAGFMGMATFTEDDFIIRKEFKYLTNCFRSIKNKYFYNEIAFKELSMGMSDDYKIALEEGSTMLRIGTLIFGERR